MDHPLARYYPSKVEDALAPEPAAFELFREFVLEHEEDVVGLASTRYTQTNEPRRSTALLPWLVREAERLGEPVHLLEAGASMGLNLCFDSYTHVFGRGHRLEGGRLRLEIEDRGPVPYPSRFPRIAGRTALDLNPLDPGDPADVAWADALIWPEQQDRRDRLRAAAGVRRTVQVDVVPGDVIGTLPGVLASLPPGIPVLVWHSFMWNQLDSDQRERFDEILADSGRSISRLGYEFWDPDESPQIRVGIRSDRMETVARAHHHGEWVEAL